MTDNSPCPSQPETITVANNADGICCDGGGGALGHPKTWYTFDKQDSVECSYCDRLFIKEQKNPLQS